MKKILTLLLRAVVGLTIVGFLIYKIDITKMFDVWAKVEWFILPLFFSTTLLMLLAGTLNVKLVLNAVGEDISYYKLLKKNLISKSIGSFLPGRLGEGSLAYLLKKEGIPYGKSVLALVIDKLISFLVIGFFSITAFFIFFEEIALHLTLIFVVFTMIVGVCLFSRSIRRLIRKYILRKYAKLFTGFGKGFRYLLRKKKKILFLNLIITIVMMLVLSSIIYLLLLYFGAKVFPLYVLIIQSAGMLSAQIPISMAGLGIRESLVVYLYNQIGINTAVVGSIYIMFAAFSYLLAGVVLLYNTKRIKL